MVSQDPRAELEILIRARYPAIYVASWEEERVEKALAAIALRLGKKLVLWSVTRGLHLPAESPSNPTGRKYCATTAKPVPALDEVLREEESALFLFKDLHPHLKDPVVVRKLRDLAAHLKSSPKTLVMVSPFLDLPDDLEKDVTVLDFGLPGASDIEAMLDGIAAQLRAQGRDLELPPPVRERLVKAALGLTLKEAENAFARTLVARGRLGEEEVELVLQEKKQAIRKSGILEYYDAREHLQDVGGLQALKEWVRKRTRSFTDEARCFGLPPPKGVLLLGVQGCGKSLCARAISQLWHLPLLRLDVGRIYSSFMGQSEANVRKAIAVAESLAPAVLWIDEVEKAFAATRSGTLDGGTSQRVFATLLTWLQEKTAPVFVIATANDISALPPELLRKGRFDEIFFVDLPDHRERREIFEIHLRRRRRDPARFDLDRLAELSQGYSGSEIEQAVVAGLYEAFDQGRELVAADLEQALRQSVPLSLTAREQIQALRDWCRGRARPASAADEVEVPA